MPEIDGQDRTDWGFPNPATAEGSAAYYVVRFSPARLQDRLAHWFAWFDHLDTIVARARDPGVARLKLDWWREEAQRIQSGQARHPLARELQQQVEQDWQVEQMSRALHWAEQRILRRQPVDLEQLHARCADRHASRLRLLCEAKAAEDTDRLEQLAIPIGLTECLQNLARDARDDFLSLPDVLLQQHRVDANALSTQDAIPGLRPLGQALLTEHTIDTRALKPLRSRPALHPAARLAAQSRRLAKQMAKYAYAGNQRRFILSPLGLLWSAWRMR